MLISVCTLLLGVLYRHCWSTTFRLVYVIHPFQHNYNIRPQMITYISYASVLILNHSRRAINNSCLTLSLHIPCSNCTAVYCTYTS